MFVAAVFKLEALDFAEPVDTNYGIDPDITIAPDDDEIVIPENPMRFADALKSAVDPLGVSDNYGIDIYEQTLHMYNF